MSGPLFYDRVQETSTTTGTGSYTLLGATTGFQSFSAVGNGNTCYYMATDGTSWEVGLGTWATGGTLTRTAIRASSNSGSAVSWSAGTKTLSLVDDATFLASLAPLASPTFTGSPVAPTPPVGDISTLLATTAFVAMAAEPDFVAQEQEASGVGGGSIGTVNTWITRVLNTVVINNISGASLASNKVTLPAGSYYIEWTVLTNSSGSGSSALNSDASGSLQLSHPIRTGNSSVQIETKGIAHVTLAVTDNLYITEQLNTNNANGLGFPSGLGTEIYSTLRIWKVT